MIAKSLTAGFLQGLAGAFDVNPVPVIQTGVADETQRYQQVLSAQAVQGASIKGASTALERVAQLYLDLAEKLFPVIEIDAARRVEVVVTRDTALALPPTGRES